MCRNIKRLRRSAPPIAASEFEEAACDLEEAACDLVRKLRGFREPSSMNREVFETAVTEIAAQARELLLKLQFPGGTAACVEA